MSRLIREWAIRGSLVVGSTLVALVFAEVLLRIFYPIHDGRDNVTLSGQPIKNWFEPGSVYRQVSNEYDARTTITDKGHRVPGVDGNPDIVFIGDSFTYGWGLSDDEQFATIYCRERGLACANLGRPGTGTSKQIDRLEEFLGKWHWKPREVKLFFFGMSGSFSAGNDFVDNFQEGRWIQARANGEQRPREEPAGGLGERIIGWQSFLLQRSNLVRIAKYHWGPMLKTLLIADFGADRLAESLRYTKQSLKRLDELSKRAGFEYSIYLLVPVQDILRGTYADTVTTLNRVSPKAVVSTAPFLLESPQQFYYAYDGHLNAKGSRRIAEFLLSLEIENHASK
jgi:hypothetical protein